MNERPAKVELDTAVPCCGARVVLFISGTYKCPCGKRRDREANAQLQKNAFLQGEIAPPDTSG